MTTREHDIDEAIDRTVRDMMDVEPSPALRARVMERLAQPRSSFRWMWIAAPLAAAAILVLVLWIPREHPITSRPVSVDARVRWTPRSVVLPRPPAVAAASGFPRAGREPSGVVARKGVERTAVAPDTPFHSTIAIGPLVDVTPIRVAGIEYERVEAVPTEIAPLAELSAVTVGPLTPPDRRN